MAREGPSERVMDYARPQTPGDSRPVRRLIEAGLVGVLVSFVVPVLGHYWSTERIVAVVIGGMFVMMVAAYGVRPWGWRALFIVLALTIFALASTLLPVWPGPQCLMGNGPRWTNLWESKYLVMCD